MITSPFGVLVPGGGASGGGSYEPALQHCFSLAFRQLPSGVDWSADCAWAVRSFNPGAVQVEAGSYNFINQVVRYPMRINAPDQAQLELAVLRGSSAMDVMLQWMSKVGRRSVDGGEVGLLIGGGGDGSCGGSAIVTMLGPDGSTVMGGWELSDIWPCAIIGGPLTHNSEADPVIHTVRFEVNAINPLAR